MPGSAQNPRHGRMIAGVVSAVNAVALICTLLGAPAPREIGWFEILAGASSGVAMLLVIYDLVAASAGSFGVTRSGLTALTLFVSPLFLSLVVAGGRGID